MRNKIPGKKFETQSLAGRAAHAPAGRSAGDPLIVRLPVIPAWKGASEVYLTMNKGNSSCLISYASTPRFLAGQGYDTNDMYD